MKHVKVVSIGVLTTITLAFLIYVAQYSSYDFPVWSFSEADQFEDVCEKPVHRDWSAGNETLGFDALLALSRGTKWRVDGIHAAAHASGITVQIPPQPGWSEPFIKAFQDFGPVEAHGAAMAWLAHIDLLKYVIAHDYGSALIMEDDVDWDVRIRNQTVLIADAVRELTGQRREKGAPYGRQWDVLWMGHCSDPPNAEDPMVVFEDETVVEHAKYRGLNRYITEVLPEGRRSVHHSWNPVCTFAYAVSAKGARKLLAQASLGKGGAFDLMLMHACQDKVVDCITVNPEIFDAYHPAGGDISEVRAGDHHEDIDTTVGQGMGSTDNIMRSARCQGLFGKNCLTNA